MNPTSSLSPRWLAALTIATAFPLYGASVTLSTGDGFGTSSFNSSGNWNPAGAPTAGNTYHVPIIQLRTPADANSYTFQGDALSIDTGGVMLYKGAGTTGLITVPNLILNGGKLDHASSYADVFTLGGGLQVAAASTIEARQGPITIQSVVTGTGALTLPATNNNNAYAVTFTGTNTYTGNITVAGNLILDPASTMTFAIGASGVNNTISGTGTAALNGTFAIDLANAGETIGDQWTLVNVTTLTETFGANFAIAGFTESDGFWTSADGKYQFDETTGVLARIAPDTDGDGLPDSWEETYLLTLAYGPTDDPDADYADNLLEYQNSTDPNLATSYPDTDADGLNDGWELYYFNNSLAQTADGDPDGDLNTNAAEQAAGTEPNNDYSFPDIDNDTLNDGWEIVHFGSLEAGIPDIDSDGDLYLNVDEMWSGTDPTDQISSPDSDNGMAGDGLPDGWEVKYFRVGEETLEEAIAHQEGTGDPDGDGYSNRSEYLAGTNPTDSASVPGPYAYWRFEEATSGSVPGDENGGAYTAAVADSSGSNNALRTWNAQTAPEYRTDVPFATVPLNGSANGSSLYFDAGTDGSWGDLVWTDIQAPLRETTFAAWTVEASFKLDTTVTGGNQAIISKDGNPLGGQPPFHVKYLAASQMLEIGLIDGSGTVRYLVGESVIETGKWYSVAATANATTLSLWLRKEGATAYLLDGTMAIDGAFYNTSPGFNDAWAVGRARWNGGETDWFKGWIDEVRISGAVLTVDKFLASGSASPFETWAAASIPDPGQRGETADPDGDGTSNLAEFRLGLDPMNGSSFFAGYLNGHTLTWPAADGLEFTIQRSTTLGAWDPITTVTTTGTTGSWTDPSPLPGKAFYRVVFTE